MFIIHKERESIAMLVLFLMLSGIISLGCAKKEAQVEQGPTDSQQIIEICRKKLDEIKSMHVITEHWVGTYGVWEVQGIVESYTVMPDKEHVIYEKQYQNGPSDIVEEWRFGEKRYIRYGDGRIETSETTGLYFLPEATILEHLKEPILKGKEHVDGSYCYIVEAKAPADLDEVQNGYFIIKLYIDEQTFLLRKLEMESYPIRYLNQPFDESFMEKSVNIYKDYDEDYNLLPPETRTRNGNRKRRYG